MLKAKETEYKDYRFRSRLEARWAVFFDTLGIKWEYEKDSYDLDGLWYIPDFWLTEQSCFIEIKGEAPTSLELKKAQLLHIKSGRPVYILAGNIGVEKTSRGDDWEHAFSCTGFINAKPVPCTWMECYSCFDIGLNPQAKDLCWHHLPYLSCQCHEKYHDAESPVYKWSRFFNGNSYGDEFSSRLINAYKAARQARFEHFKPPIPDVIPTKIHTLTIETVKERWDYIKRRIKSKKDGGKIAAILNGCSIIGVEGANEPVIVLRANANFFYQETAKKPGVREILEWSMTIELEQTCRVKILEPIAADDLQLPPPAQRQKGA